MVRRRRSPATALESSDEGGDDQRIRRVSADRPDHEAWAQGDQLRGCVGAWRITGLVLNGHPTRQRGVGQQQFCRDEVPGRRMLATRRSSFPILNGCSTCTGKVAGGRAGGRESHVRWYRRGPFPGNGSPDFAYDKTEYLLYKATRWVDYAVAHYLSAPRPRQLRS